MYLLLWNATFDDILHETDLTSFSVNFCQVFFLCQNYFFEQWENPTWVIGNLQFSLDSNNIIPPFI